MGSTGCLDGTAAWEVANGTLFGTPMQNDSEVCRVAFSPDNETVCVGYQDGTAQFWRTKTCNRLGAPLRCAGAVTSLAYRPDGRFVLIGSTDGRAHFWEVPTGRNTWSDPFPPIQAAANCVVFSPDGKTVAASCQDRSLRLYRSDTGQAIGNPMVHDGEINQVVFSPDGHKLLSTATRNKKTTDANSIPQVSIGRGTAVSDGVLQLWNVETQSPIGEPLVLSSKIRSAEFSPDGRKILTGIGIEVQLWDAANLKPVSRPFANDGAIITDAAFSHDSRIVATVGYDCIARLWDADSGKLQGNTIQHGDWVRCVTFSPDDRTLVTGTDEWRS